MPGPPEESPVGLHGPVPAPSRQNQLVHHSTGLNEGPKHLMETDSRPNILEILAATAAVVTAGTKDSQGTCVLDTGLGRDAYRLPGSFAEKPLSSDVRVVHGFKTSRAALDWSRAASPAALWCVRSGECSQPVPRHPAYEISCWDVASRCPTIPGPRIDARLLDSRE